MKVKVETLKGNALLWAVCVALKHSPVVDATGISYRSDHGSWVHPRFTSDEEAGELMSKEWIGVERPFKGQKTPLWHAITDIKLPTSSSGLNSVVSAWGATLGVAVCRAIVLARCGDIVEVPTELLDAVLA